MVIPAGAGNSRRIVRLSGIESVYPRWRGELFSDEDLLVFTFGLSPLARGTPSSVSFLTSTVRFIPAGAGNSWQPAPQRRAGAVYPRWRGELFGYIPVFGIVGGLSPLARGTQARDEKHARAKRFIPAGAGNSTQVTTHAAPLSVYPRWRGELCLSHRR